MPQTGTGAGANAFSDRLAAQVSAATKSRFDVTDHASSHAEPAPAKPASSDSDEFNQRLAQMTKRANARASYRPPPPTPESEPPADDFSRRLEALNGSRRDDAETQPAVDESPAPVGPVGTGNYAVKQGDCICSIAHEHGHLWKTLWSDPGNAELREVRQDANVLLPGDRVHVPPLREKQEPGQTEQRHRFHRRGAPAELHLRFLEDGEPLGNQPYVLQVEGATIEGTLDAQGRLSTPIPSWARKASIRIGEDEPREYQIDLGEMDPCQTVSGLQRRLRNLGHEPGRIDGELDDATRAAIKRFQIARKLPATGEPDQATHEELRRCHES